MASHLGGSEARRSILLHWQGLNLNAVSDVAACFGSPWGCRSWKKTRAVPYLFEIGFIPDKVECQCLSVCYLKLVPRQSQNYCGPRSQRDHSTFIQGYVKKQFQLLINVMCKTIGKHWFKYDFKTFDAFSRYLAFSQWYTIKSYDYIITHLKKGYATIPKKRFIVLVNILHDST